MEENNITLTHNENINPSPRVADVNPLTIDNKKVLVIDDEFAVREAVSDILEIADVDTVLAGGGVEGITLYQEHQAEIGLVILDLSMPGLNGEETLKQLKAFDSEVRVLLSSGYRKQEIIQRYGELDVCGYISKPYGMNSLIATVKDELSL